MNNDVYVYEVVPINALLTEYNKVLMEDCVGDFMMQEEFDNVGGIVGQYRWNNNNNAKLNTIAFDQAIAAAVTDFSNTKKKSIHMPDDLLEVWNHNDSVQWNVKKALATANLRKVGKFIKAKAGPSDKKVMSSNIKKAKIQFCYITEKVVADICGMEEGITFCYSNRLSTIQGSALMVKKMGCFKDIVAYHALQPKPTIDDDMWPLLLKWVNEAELPVADD